MPAIYDDKGTELADIPLSEKQSAVLAKGEDIVVFYHTPQLLRSLLGDQNGKFILKKQDDKIVTSDPIALKNYAGLQRRIKAARGE